ncbi:MAG: nitroreductase family protein [Chloroflexi bacterium]|nr:nitroreductase family protein [Chloroflexota bacterium]
METIEVIRNRRSIKSYQPTPVPRETLQNLVDLARYSPSGANKNAWRFVVTTERDSLQRLSQIARTCSWLATAPAGIAIAADPAATRYWLEDTSVAAYLICLAAAAQGLGAAWAAKHQSDNPDESKRRQDMVRDILSIPGSLMVPMVLAIGYPETQPPPRTRPELTDILFWERYTTKE